MVDLILLSILLVFVIYGCVKGFFRQVLAFFGTIFAVVFAVIFCRKLAELWISHSNVLNFFAEKVVNLFGLESVEVQSSAVGAKLNETALPHFMVRLIEKAIEGTQSATVNFATVVSETVAKYVVILISFLAIFFAIKILSLILRLLFNLIRKSRVINGTDRLLGAILALIRGMSLIYTVLMLIDLLPFEFLFKIKEIISDSTIGAFLSKYNVLSMILSPIVSKVL